MGSVPNQNKGGQGAAQFKKNPPRTKPNENLVLQRQMFVDRMITQTFEIVTERAIEFALKKKDPAVEEWSGTRRSNHSEAGAYINFIGWKTDRIFS